MLNLTSPIEIMNRTTIEVLALASSKSESDLFRLDSTFAGERPLFDKPMEVRKHRMILSN